MAVIILRKFYQMQEGFANSETTLVSAELGFENAVSLFVMIGQWNFKSCSCYSFLWPIEGLLWNILSSKSIHFFIECY